MPLIDMPMEALKTYTGTNPKPADHEAYWNRALAQLDAQDPQTEFVKADFQVPGYLCYDMWFTPITVTRSPGKPMIWPFSSFWTCNAQTVS